MARYLGLVLMIIGAVTVGEALFYTTYYFLKWVEYKTRTRRRLTARKLMQFKKAK